MTGEEAEMPRIKTGFKGRIEQAPEGERLRVEEEGGEMRSLTLEEDVAGHLGDLQGATITAKDEEGTPWEIVLERVEGDDVEGHGYKGP
jgi:hypothetical protein